MVFIYVGICPFIFFLKKKILAILGSNIFLHIFPYAIYNYILNIIYTCIGPIQIEYETASLVQVKLVYGFELDS